MNRVLPLLGILILAQPAFAALPPDASEKYHLQVVFRCGAHNWLGDQFRDDLRNDLAGILQDALGGMGDVKVIDLKKVTPAETDPFLKDLQARGFAALEVSRELTGLKTQFLQVDFANGFYELQSRQYDGSTGYVSPLRRDRTADRALVTRLAGQLIARDFGAIGTVTGKGEDSGGQGEVTVSFRGGALMNTLDRWIHRNDVFAVYYITATADKKERGGLQANTLIQLTDDPKNGVAPGRIVFRTDNPLKNANLVLGFRCIRLNTTVGPLRLRLVDENNIVHKGLQIRVHRDRFQQGLSEQEEVIEPDRTGLYVTNKSYTNVAFVRIVTGSQSIARVPAEVLEDRPLTVSVGVSKDQETRGQLVYKRGELLRQFEDSRYVHLISAFREINDLVRQGKNKEALDRATRSRDALDEDIKRLATNFDELKKEIGTQQIPTEDCEKIAADLAKRKTAINQKIGELGEVVRRANDPMVLATQKKFEESLAKAQALVESNEYDAAIAQYKSILATKEFGEQPAVKKSLDALEASWAVKSPEQKQARDFVFDKWAKVKSSADIEANLPTARQKLQVLTQTKDDLTLLKLRNTLLDVGKIIRDESQALNPEEKDKIEKFKKLVEDLDKFSQDVEAAILKK